MQLEVRHGTCSTYRFIQSKDVPRISISNRLVTLSLHDGPPVTPLNNPHRVINKPMHRTVILRTTSFADETGILNLVDLAGSERLKKSASEGQRKTEALHINSSLTVLGKVSTSQYCISPACVSVQLDIAPIVLGTKLVVFRQ